MTTLTQAHGRVDTAAPQPSPRNGHPMKRIWNIARLQVVNRWTVFWIPMMILGFIWLVNVAIWWILSSSLETADFADASEGMQWSGASFYIFVYMLVIAAQAMTMTFPFALGLSVTRREYYLGSLIAFVLLALVYGLGMTLLSLLERATNGWGFGGTMFSAVYFGQGPFFETLFVFAVAFLFFFVVGTFGGTIYMRWRTNGMLVAGAVLALAVIGLVALVTFTGSWPLVGEWFAAAGPTGVVACLLVPTVLFSLAGYVALSRATPKS